MPRDVSLWVACSLGEDFGERDTMIGGEEAEAAASTRRRLVVFLPLLRMRRPIKSGCAGKPHASPQCLRGLAFLAVSPGCVRLSAPASHSWL